MIVKVHRSSCKIPVILVPFEWNLNFFDKFSKKNIQISDFMKISPVGTELFHADVRKDGHYDAVTLRKSADRIKAKFG